MTPSVEGFPAQINGTAAASVPGTLAIFNETGDDCCGFSLDGQAGAGSVRRGVKHTTRSL